MKFLIRYSNCIWSEEPAAKLLPVEGSMIEADTIEELLNSAARWGCPIILRHDNDHPWWADWWTPDEGEPLHRVDQLTPGWQKMRWIEIYNGYRE